ncbi:hypothetical protein NDU88_006517 [Pleurodeles waltl]|uniref:Uncharacterized protein n=1 Tax=Pleurodeles waltl TaxID=8319 RepID=A0AAV7X1I1_PLEWA|nr:hypothetical protein NDU88_006517 [Pleurodeles waltl]
MARPSYIIKMAQLIRVPALIEADLMESSFADINPIRQRLDKLEEALAEDRKLLKYKEKKHSDHGSPLLRVPLSGGERREGAAARNRGPKARGDCGAGPSRTWAALAIGGRGVQWGRPRTEGPGGVRWSAGSSGWRQRRQAEEVRAWRPRPYTCPVSFGLLRPGQPFWCREPAEAVVRCGRLPLGPREERYRGVLGHAGTLVSGTVGPRWFCLGRAWACAAWRGRDREEPDCSECPHLWPSGGEQGGNDFAILGVGG